VRVQTVYEVLEDPILTIPSIIIRHTDHSTQSIGDHADLAVLHVLPNPMGHVEHEALK